MSTVAKLSVVGALAFAVLAVFAMKSPPDPQAGPSPVTVKTKPLPRLLDLGSDKCIPCKQMQPILAGLRKAYKGKLQVDFIDVWKDPKAGELYKVEMIPTQIFFDAKGKELYRQVGFYGKKDIETKMRELGFKL